MRKEKRGRQETVGDACPWHLSKVYKPRPCKKGNRMQRITALPFWWCFPALVALRLDLQVQWVLPGTWSTPGHPKRFLSRSGWDLGVQSWAGWIHGWWWLQCALDGLTQTHRGRPELPNHLPAAMEMRNICALFGLVSQHLNRFVVSKRSKRALKCRLKALVKYRTPQKDNLNFCHFKLCMAGVLEQPPRLMSQEFKQQLKKSVINTEQFAFCLPVAFPGFRRPSTDGELLISHFGPHHRW